MGVFGGWGMKAGWQCKTLGEVLDKTETVNPLQSPDTEFDYIDVSSVSNTTFEVEQTQRLKGKDAPSRARKLVKTNDVIFATIRPTLRRIAIVPPHLNKQVCSTGYFVLRPKTTLNHRFVYYWLFADEFMGQMEALQKGASYPAVTDKEVRDQVIPFPPLPEQQRIVTLLDEAFDGIATARAHAEKNLQNARAIFESHLDAVLSRTGAGYTETTLGAEVDLLPGYAFPSSGYTDATDAVRLLRGDNIMQGYFRWEEAKGWPSDDCSSYSRFALQEGDVILAMDRPWVKAGLKRAQICADDLPSLLVQRTSRLRTLGKIRMDFLFHLTSSQSFSRHLLEVQTGIGVPHISGKQIESFKFMLPPMSDQESIANTLNELLSNTQRLEEIYEEKLTALDALKKSLLHRAFNGDL